MRRPGFSQRVLRPIEGVLRHARCGISTEANVAASGEAAESGGASRENEDRRSSSSRRGGGGRAGQFAGYLLGALLFPVASYAGAHFTGTLDMYRAMVARREEEALVARAAAARPALGGPFELVDADTAALVSDRDVFLGHWTLLYFGFTKCAEICPNTMRFIADVLQASARECALDNPKEVAALQACFVSVDHVRDRPEVVRAFIDRYRPPGAPSVVGLCGSLQQIRTAADAWRVYYSSLDETADEAAAREAKGVAKQDALDDAYQFDHSAAIYLVGPDGKMKDFFFREIGVPTTTERIKMHFDDVYGINS